MINLKGILFKVPFPINIKVCDRWFLMFKFDNNKTYSSAQSREINYIGTHPLYAGVIVRQ